MVFLAAVAAVAVVVVGEQAYGVDSTLLKHPKHNATFIEFPHHVEAEFAVKGQVKVVADTDGAVYRGSLAKMGHHCHCLGVTQAIRKQLGKYSGDVVNVMIRQDNDLRAVEVPPDIQTLLDQDLMVKGYFNGLSYTNCKEHVTWVTSAQKESTKQNHIE